MIQTVSNTYSISYLWNHPETKDIMRRYLGRLEEQTRGLQATLADLQDYNAVNGRVSRGTLMALC